MAQDEHKEWAFSFLGLCPSHVKCTSGSFDLGGLEPLSNRRSLCLSAGFPRCSLLQVDKENALRWARTSKKACERCE